MRLHLFFIIAFLLYSCQPESKEVRATPEVQKGEISIDSSLFSGSKPFINLDGTWDFFWKQFVEPGKNIQTNLAIPVPSIWNGFDVGGSKIDGTGYGTYRIKILIPDEKEVQSIQNLLLGIKMPDIGTSYQIFFNGKLINTVGKIGISEKDTVPRYEPDVFVLPNLWKSENEILLHVSNFKHARGGLWESIKIGDLKSLQNLRFQNLFIAIFLIGGMSLIGFYHLGLFILRTKDKSTLYFGLFCLNIALRTLLTGEMFFSQIFPMFSWEFGLVLEYLTLSAGVTSFLLFIRSIFPNEVSRFLSKAVLIYSNILTFLVLALPSIYYTKILGFIQVSIVATVFLGLYAMGIAIYKKISGSLSFFIGFIFFAIITINDILHTNGVINTGYYGTFGFLVFVFSQAFFLSMRSSRAFVQVEELTESLELKVEERTKDLEISQKETEELNKLIKSLNDELEIEQIMGKVLKFVQDNFGIQHYGLFRANADKSFLQCLAISFPDHVSQADRDLILELKFPIQNVRGANAFALLAKNPIYWPKVKRTGITKEELFIIEVGNLQSYLMIPLLLRNQTIGILHFYNEDKLTLTKDDLTKLSILGEQIAGIIYGSNLYKQVQEEKALAISAQKEAETIKNEIILFNDFSKKLNSLVHLDLILDHIFKYMIENFDFDLVNFYQVNQNNKNLYFVRSYSKTPISESTIKILSETQIPLNRDLSVQGIVYEKKRYFYLPSIKHTFKDLDTFFHKLLQIKSLLIIPLVVNKVVIGMFHITDFLKKGLYRKNQINRFLRFTEQISIAINSANLINEINHAKDSLEKLNEITKKVNSSEDLRIILKIIYDYLKLEYKISSFWLLNVDPINNELYSSHLLGSEDSEHIKNLVNLKIPLKVESGSLFRTYTKKKPLYMPRINKNYSNKLDNFIVESLSIDSLLQLPLIVGEEVIGILCFSRKELSLSKSQISDIVRFGDQVAGALYNSFLLNDTRIAQKVAADQTEVILKSISYAKTIQDSILPEAVWLDSVFKEHFLIWKPRDIVGGDLYWARESTEAVFIAVIDCIGHGVSGAFITMLAHSILNRIIDSKEKTTPSQILEELDYHIKQTIHQNELEANPDVGLDIGLCMYLPDSKELIFAGSKISLYIESKGKIERIPGIGKAIGERNGRSKNFVDNKLTIQEANYFYLFSDGLYSQIGGEKNFPLGRSNFLAKLEELIDLNSDQKKEKLLEFYENYQGNEEQIDDITVLGFKL